MKKNTPNASQGAMPKAGAGRGEASTSSEQASSSKAIVPILSIGMAPIKMTTTKDDLIAPEGYTMRKIVPAKNYDDVVSFRSMNDDFDAKMKKLFDPETEAAVIAQKTGVYVSWRCPEDTNDCQRVNKKSKCFCGHLLEEHENYNGHSVHVKCKMGGCLCKAYAWTPSRPEEIGEFWFQRKRGFDVTKWRCKCKCKHTHEEHDPNGLHGCRIPGCCCGAFFSKFLCAACDKQWEIHETFFETEAMRREKGLPVGEMDVPFAEMQELRNVTFSVEDGNDSVFTSLTKTSIPECTSSHGIDAADNVSGGGAGCSSAGQSGAGRSGSGRSGSGRSGAGQSGTGSEWF